MWPLCTVKRKSQILTKSMMNDELFEEFSEDNHFYPWERGHHWNGICVMWKHTIMDPSF